MIGLGKDTDRETVRSKFAMVKHVDRVGRMADTLEFTELALPLARFSPELREQFDRLAPSMVEVDGETLVIRRCYAERRMVPLIYDYDEIEYLTDINFRRIPPPPNPEAELSGEPWYAVHRNDVFPYPQALRFEALP